MLLRDVASFTTCPKDHMAAREYCCFTYYDSIIDCDLDFIAQ